MEPGRSLEIDRLEGLALVAQRASLCGRDHSANGLVECAVEIAAHVALLRRAFGA